MAQFLIIALLITVFIISMEPTVALAHLRGGMSDREARKLIVREKLAKPIYPGSKVMVKQWVTVDKYAELTKGLKKTKVNTK